MNSSTLVVILLVLARLCTRYLILCTVGSDK